MFVAAPILPGTPDYRIAETLSLLAAVPDYALLSLLEEEWQNAGLDDSVLGLSTAEARRIIDEKLAERKIVSTHYQHVDGTSFAAPVTASVVARMLEANPALSPAAVKNILTSTASKISGNPAIRQGFGMLNGVRAIELARFETHDLGMGSFRPPHVESGSIVFYYHDDEAKKVNLAGDFNNWGIEATALSRTSDGIWTAAIPCQPSGTYRYKFVVDQRRWIEDPSHGFKEPDQLGGFNSLLIIN
jgi:serine protease AprX